MQAVRAVRGANKVEKNSSDAVLKATRELLDSMVQENNIRVEDIISVFFTLSPDLNAEFPARAARSMGWTEVPMLCAVEIDVPGALSSCLRVLMHIYSPLTVTEVKHIYLGETVKLRPDLCLQKS